MFNPVFRNLRADEIDVRVGRVNTAGVSLLLYKDARCDMNILDETVGPMNWTRSHSRDNANCTVSIYDPDKGAWISKEDTGVESKTEAEKGLASDSFKRACVNWGIGRELYTAPDIFIWKNMLSFDQNKKLEGSFSVGSISYIGSTKAIESVTILYVAKRNGTPQQVFPAIGRNDENVQNSQESRPEGTTKATEHQAATVPRTNAFNPIQYIQTKCEKLQITSAQLNGLRLKFVAENTFPDKPWPELNKVEATKLIALVEQYLKNSGAA